jgi:hypothetical protein
LFEFQNPAQLRDRCRPKRRRQSASKRIFTETNRMRTTTSSIFPNTPDSISHGYSPTVFTPCLPKARSRVLLTFVDITERKKAEERLRLSEEHLGR